MRRFPAVLLSALTLAGAKAPAQSVPAIRFDASIDFLKLPANLYLGEVAGVAVNSKGHVFVYSRTGERSTVHGATAAQLFEFGPDGAFIREIGKDLYGFAFAHTVRIDGEDNIWATDEGTNMIIKFNPAGRVTMVLGRREEAAEPAAPRPANAPAPAPGWGSFNRPTDVAWDAAGDIFVADGYGNSRVAKFDKNGAYIKSWGSKGTGPGQFDLLHAIAVDAAGNVYVGDRSNKRIQVFDNNGTFKTQYTNVGAPYAMCITPGPHQYLYTSNSNPSTSMENGEIYKMELDGKVLGKFGRAGKLLKEFGTVHELDCRSANEIYAGELTNWRVQKLTLHP